MLPTGLTFFVLPENFPFFFLLRGLWFKEVIMEAESLEWRAVVCQEDEHTSELSKESRLEEPGGASSPLPHPHHPSLPPWLEQQGGQKAN